MLIWRILVKWTLKKCDGEVMELIDLARETDKEGPLVNAVLNS